MPRMGTHIKPWPSSFWDKVDRVNGPIPASRPELGQCWIWTAYRDHRGYGHGTTVPAPGRGHRTHWSHRTAYLIVHGIIPAGLDLDHLCRNPSCVNPTHLEPVTRRVNLLRGVGSPALCAARDTCANGHPYTPENTRLYRGYRRCITCEREWNRQGTARRRVRRRDPHANESARVAA